MGEELKVSAYAISVATSAQNLNNVFVNGRYVTAAEERSVINKVAHADFQVYGVSDGQIKGGHPEEGAFPTASAMQRLQRLQADMAEENRIDKDKIWDYLVEINRDMKQYRSGIEAEDGGASIAALFLHGNRGLAVHLGDSRIYVIRGGRMLQITEDHLQATDLYKYGVITQKQAEVHKRDSRLTAFIGMDDIYDAEDTVFSKYFVFYPDDLFIICNDGITDYISNEELERLVRGMRDASADEVAQTLISEVGEASNDDKSIIVLRIEDAPGSAAPQRGTSAMPQRENFDREVPQDEPQVPVTDTTKLSSIATGIVEEEERRAQDPDDPGYEDEDEEGESLVDKILGNPKRLAIILGGILVLIILIALISKALKGKGNTPSKQESSPESSISEEISSESSIDESSVITPDSSTDSSQPDSSVPGADSSETSDSSTTDDSSDELDDESSDSDSSQAGPTETGTYTVEAGDTLYGIIVDHYGSYDEAILEYLQEHYDVDPGNLQIGQEITLPTLEEMGLE